MNFLFQLRGKTLKKMLIILYLILPATKSFASWPETDKAAHFGLSSVAVESLIKTCLAIKPEPKLNCHLWSSGAVLLLGLAKEQHDQQQGKAFDSKDMSANVLGIITGNLLQWQF